MVEQRSRRIMLVDSDARVRSALKMLLSCELDITLVEESANTNNLIEKVLAHKPHIIFLDWESTNSDAASMLSSLHQIDSRPGIIVLGSRAEYEPQALQAGADVFVSKTDPPDTLIGTIHALGELDAPQKG